MPANPLETTVRHITAYPHKGTTYFCDDTLNIADVQEANDSANHAILTGVNAINGAARGYNLGTGFFPIFQFTNPNLSILAIPVIGQSMGTIAIPYDWPWNGSLEFISGLPKFTIVMTLRLLTEGEFRFGSNPSGPWVGGRSSLFTIGLGSYTSAGSLVNQPIIEFYGDLPYFQANYGGVNQAIAVDWRNVSGSGFKQIVITGTLNSNMTSANTAHLGRLNFRMAYKEKPDGGPWTTNQNLFGYEPRMDLAPHPTTGVEYACDGVMDFTLYLHK